MNVEIYRLDHALETHKSVSLITVPTAEGIRGFMPHHMTFIGELSKGAVTVTSLGKSTNINVDKGYVEFQNNTCKIFVME